jgi:anthranilate phosphoribosyltransferase
VEVDESGVRRDYYLSPEEFGITRRSVEQLRGGTAAENSVTAHAVLSGSGPAAIREAVLLNAGASLYICGLARNIGEGFARAQEALQSGRAAEKLEQIRARGKASARAA